MPAGTSGYTCGMDVVRRQAVEAALGLAVVMSVAAAVLAVVSDAIGHGSPAMLVAIVMAVGFVTSWVLTGRIARPQPMLQPHRVTVVPARHHVG